jgi:hypothetical protein
MNLFESWLFHVLYLVFSPYLVHEELVDNMVFLVAKVDPFIKIKGRSKPFVWIFAGITLIAFFQAVFDCQFLVAVFFYFLLQLYYILFL